MDKIVAAVADFKENCTNTKLVQELNPWLSSLNDVATGIKAILKSAQALQEMMQKRHGRISVQQQKH